jgi:hypothetical protein
MPDTSDHDAPTQPLTMGDIRTFEAPTHGWLPESRFEGDKSEERSDAFEFLADNDVRFYSSDSDDEDDDEDEDEDEDGRSSEGDDDAY